MNYYIYKNMDKLFEFGLHFDKNKIEYKYDKSYIYLQLY